MDAFWSFTFRAQVAFFRTICSVMLGRYTTAQDETLDIPSRDPGRTIKGHLYHSHTRVTAGAKNQKVPILISWHGSGFVAPMFGIDDRFCRYVRDNTDYAVLDMSYRLAPENPYPAAMDDGEDAIKWVLSQGDTYDISRISLSGFSAGATIALSQAADPAFRNKIHSVIPYYPVAEWVTPAQERRQPAYPKGSPISPWALNLFKTAFLPPSIDPANPRASPAYYPAEAFPNRVLMITCSGDSLAVEGEALAEKIKAAGKHVVSRRVEDEHGFNLVCKEESESGKRMSEVYDLTAKFLQDQI